MPILRVAGATLNQTPLDFRGNQARILSLLQQARAAEVELLCLPELCITGYGCEDAFFSMHTVRMAAASLQELLAATSGLAVVFGMPHYHAGALYNVAVMVQNGRILGGNAKRVLPREGVHYEPRWFRPWAFGCVAETELCGQRVPFGDVRYRFGEVGVGLEICEEAWDSTPASERHADALDIILNPSASHFALGKYKKREQLVANSSRALQVHYVYSNLLGCEAGRMIYDGGVLIADAGRVAVRGSRFGFHDGALTWRDINTDSARVAKMKSQPVKESHPLPRVHAELNQAGVLNPPVEIYGAAFHGRSVAVLDAAPDMAMSIFSDPHHEFLAAEMLGLFDYMRKTSAKGFVLSLSGGCDSACCAVLVAHMLSEALRELGPQVLQQRLALDFEVAGLTACQLVGRLLTCVYQASENSSAITETAAAAVAAAIGASYHRVDLAPTVASYTALAEHIVGRPLTWQRDDLTLQNIQARSRAPLIWMLANIKNALLITTGNRSEAAVGYATMDGDTAGGLAPLAGIDKHFLQQWLAFAEIDCQRGLGPIAALRLIRQQAPTAELRPEAQTDEADLMPYTVLAWLERCWVRDFLSPAEALQVLTREFPQTPVATLKSYCERFYKLWTQSQWKRERLAPSFYLDDPSLDPRTACRFPIVSGFL